MIKAIIVDDEQHALDRLSNLLTTYCADTVHLMGVYQSVEEGVEAIERLCPDLVFLDVELQNQTAFDLLEQVNKITFDIIFTTAHAEYALQAIKLSAIDYLVKRIDPDDLTAAIEKLNRKKSREERTRQLEVLLEGVKNPHGLSKKIIVPTSNGLTVLSSADIIRCEGESNYTNIYIKDVKDSFKEIKYLVAKTLGDYEELLSDFSFFRVHNSHLINLTFVKNYNNDGFVTMANGTLIPVSTRRKQAFLKKLADG